MLECGKNFGGTIGGTCSVCNLYDDEDHRLNHCKKFKDMNYHDQVDKIVFINIYSEDINSLRDTIEIIQKVWNTKNTGGKMNLKCNNTAHL